MGETETLADLQAAFDCAEVPFHPGKLERWRREGLLPRVEQQALGRILGSRTLYPRGTAEQAIEIERLFCTKRKIAFVGWELWWRGFDVDPRYWQPALAKAHASLPRTIRIFKRWQSRESEADREDTVIERHGRDLLRATPLIGTVGNMPAARISMALGILADAACGEFQAFDSSSTDQEAHQEYESVRDALGFRRSKHHSIRNLYIDPKAPLTDVFSAIASINWATIELHAPPFTEFEKARTEIHDAFRAGSLFYQATAWIFGNGAFGLRLVDWFLHKAPIAVKANILILWWAIRSQDGLFMNGDEIREMRIAAALALRNSSVIQELRSNNPMLFEILSPENIKRAFRSDSAAVALQLRIKTAISNGVNNDLS